MPPPLLLLLLVLSPGPGGVPCLALADICDSAQTIVTQSEDKIVPGKSNVTAGLGKTTVYMMPQTGFQGVTLETKNQEGPYEAWFDFGDFDERCLEPKYIWFELKATVRIIQPSENLNFKVEIGECLMECQGQGPVDTLYELKIRAHGPSKWRDTHPPSHCFVKEVVYSASTNTKRTCHPQPSRRGPTFTTTTTKKPPRPPSRPSHRRPTSTTTTTKKPPRPSHRPPTTRTTATTATTLAEDEDDAPFSVVGIAVGAVLGAVGVGIVVVVLVVKRRRQNGPPRTGEASPAPQPGNDQDNYVLPNLPVLRQTPRVADSHVYDSCHIQIYDDVIPRSHQASPPVTEDRHYENVHLYANVGTDVPQPGHYENVQQYAAPGQHGEAPPPTEEPLYMVVQ